MGNQRITFNFKLICFEKFAGEKFVMFCFSVLNLKEMLIFVALMVSLEQNARIFEDKSQRCEDFMGFLSSFRLPFGHFIQRSLGMSQFI